MAQLAIKGHETRGKEVIEILEMLGGVNKSNYTADSEGLYFYISHSTSTICYDWLSAVQNDSLGYVTYTLKEFLEKYPHKVGDKVRFSDSNTPFTISRIWWDNNASELICTLEEQDIDVSSVDLQPYKEETMKEKGILVQIDLTKELCIADEVEVILGDYEFVLKDGKTYFVKKKPKYPKTYEECCEVLGICPNGDIVYAGNWTYGGEYLEKHLERIRNFQKLLICRDAYWKIAGEQMGLEKPWEPDFDNEDEYKYGLFRLRNIIYKDATCINPTLLIFPTAEMRDTFYDNFKKEIESCKELL